MSSDARPAPPASYAQWSGCLDLFESGLDDAGAIAAMRAGTLGWTSGVAERFSDRIAAVFNTRLTRCADRLSRELRTGSDEVTLVRALVSTRDSLALLHTVANLPPFPAVLREHLCASLETYATRSQQSLEDSARHDRSGRIAGIIRNNGLLRYASQSAPSGIDAPPGATSQPPSAAGSRRRNILA